MKLSEQIYHDFLKDAYPETMKTRSYEMSYGYLIDLIEKIEKMNVLDKMLPNTALFKHNDDTWTVRSCVMLEDKGYYVHPGMVPNEYTYYKTPEEAIDEWLLKWNGLFGTNNT